MPSKSKILKSGLIVFLFTLGAKGFGLLRDILIANKFGSSAISDSYFFALQIPNVLMFILGVTILGGMSSSLFSSAIEKNRQDEVETMFSAIFNYAFLLTLFVTIISIWQMPAVIEFVGFLTGAFTTPETFELTVKLARILITLMITISLSEYLASSLRAFREFALPGFSQLLAFVSMVIALVFFSDRFGIESLAWGSAFGFLASVIIQFSYIVFKHIKFRFEFNLFTHELKNYIKKAAPLLLVTGIAPFSMLVSNMVALSIDEGSLSRFNYALKINELSTGLLVVPFMTVLLPEFARDATSENLVKLKEKIKFSGEVIFMVMLFWIAFLSIYHQDVIQILFNHGQFSSANAYETSNILFVFIFGMMFSAGYLVLTFIYLGLQATRSLALIGFLSYSLNIGVIFIFAKEFGIYGLAAANALNSIVYCGLLFYWLNKKYLNFRIMKNLRRPLTILLSGLIAGGVMYGISYLMPNLRFGDNKAMMLISMSVSFLIALVVYALLLNMFKIFEVKSIIKKILKNA